MGTLREERVGHDHKPDAFSRDGLAILEGWRFDQFGRDALDLVEGRLGFGVVGGKLKMTRTEGLA